MISVCIDGCMELLQARQGLRKLSASVSGRGAHMISYMSAAHCIPAVFLSCTTSEPNCKQGTTTEPTRKQGRLGPHTHEYSSLHPSSFSELHYY